MGGRRGVKWPAKGFMKKCQRKMNRWNRPWYGPHRAHNQIAKRSLFSTTKLYSHTQSSTFPLELHEGRGLVEDSSERKVLRAHWRSVRSVRTDRQWARKNSQQKQTTQDYFILALKLDKALMCLCVCRKKFNFLSWVIRPVFADPVTYIKAWSGIY